MHLEESVFLRNDSDIVSLIIGVATDITNSKLQQLELDERRNFLNSFLDTTPGSIFIMDIQDRPKALFDSMNTVRSLGYNSEEMVQLGTDMYSKLMHPDDMEKVMDNIAKMKVQKTNEELNYEVRFRHADGSWRWFQITIRPYRRHKDGKIIEVAGVAIEITGMKEAELKLRESQEFNEKIIATSPGSIFIVDLVELKDIFVSENTFQLYGYTPEELIGFGSDLYPKIVHSDDLHIVMEAREELMAMNEDRIISNELRFRHANGEWRWVAFNLAPFKRDEDGKIIQAIGMTMDITQRKEAEVKLRENQEFIEKVMTTIPGDIFLSDPKERKILFASNITQTTGYTLEEIIKMGPEFLTILVHPEDLLEIKNINESIANSKTDQIIYGEQRYRHKNGQWRWLGLSLRPFKRNEKGDVTQAIGVVLDINEKKEAELELKETQELLIKITETVPEDLYVFDISRNETIFASRNLIKALGYTSEQISEMGENTMYLLAHPEDLPQLMRENKEFRYASDEDILTQEFRAKDAKGNWHWILVRNKVFKRNEKGEAIQLVSAAGDITPIKETEIRLEESRKFVVKITETSPNIILIFDIVNRKPVYVNKAVEDFLWLFSRRVSSNGK